MSIRAREQYILKFAAAILGASVLSILLAVVTLLVFQEPTPTVRESLAEIFRPYRFGIAADAAPWLFAAAFAASVLGFAAGTVWGYACLLALMGFVSLATFNPLTAAVTAVLVRSWSHFVSHRPHEADPPIEWRHLLIAGALLFGVFGVRLATVAPVRFIPEPQPTSVTSAPTSPARSGPLQTDLVRTVAILRAVRDFSLELQSAKTNGQIVIFPLSDRPVALETLAPAFPSPLRLSITALPLDGRIAYWSNGTSYAFFAAVPTPFTHPKLLAIEPPPGTVLVRTDSDGANDLDLDGLTDEREALLTTSPAAADTDGDGVTDGREVGAGRDPLDADR